MAMLWAIAVVTPGPNLLAVLAAARQSRAHALWTVVGVGIGTACWGLAGSFGLLALFAVAPWLFLALKLVGGGYLVVVGVRSIVAAARGGTRATGSPLGGRPLLGGLLTNLSNPKSALFVASLFAATMPSGSPGPAFGFAAAALMAGISVTWYGSVAVLASSALVGGALRRRQRGLEALAGVAFSGFGLRLMWEAR